MKRSILAIAGTISGLVILLGFKTHPAGQAAGGVTDTSAGTTTGQSPGTPSQSPSGGSSGTRTLKGSTIDTRWGPVQVQVTLTNGKITKVTALQLPDGNQRDREINDFAVPQLTQETLSAQSARIDSVSGATYTSDGYVRSLQSALDKA
jgi:uncharacterized protein with FMN-binding domain